MSDAAYLAAYENTSQDDYIEQHSELFVPAGLVWQDHPYVYDAIDIMPQYMEYSNDYTPAEFINQYWDYATDGLRLQMIEYIQAHPFEGCEKYTQAWNAYLERKKGKVLTLI